jgi:hypothetical protein
MPTSEQEKTGKYLKKLERDMVREEESTIEANANLCVVGKTCSIEGFRCILACRPLTSGKIGGRYCQLSPWQLHDYMY